MHGFGDQLWQKPFVSAFVEKETAKGNVVYIRTPLPQFYTDISKLKFVRTSSDLRTQQKSLDSGRDSRVKYANVTRVKFNRTIAPHYGLNEVRGQSIIHHMSKVFDGLPFEQSRMTVPFLNDTDLNITDTRKPIAVIRPVTIRSEWPCPARAPDPNYIAWCSRLLMNSGYRVISIADVDGINEVIKGPAPVAHESYHAGELSMDQSMKLMSIADMTIGGSGWILPAAIAMQCPLFLIFGGRGMYDSPQKLFDPRMNLSRIGWSMPVNFCRCSIDNHDCDKRITTLDSDFFRFMNQLQRAGA